MHSQNLSHPPKAIIKSSTPTKTQKINKNAPQGPIEQNEDLFRESLVTVDNQASLQLSVISKIQFLVKEYFKIVPEVQKFQIQIATLVDYNKRLYQILMMFEKQEYTLINRLSKLEDIHIETYSEFCKMKGKEGKRPKKSIPQSIFTKFDLRKLKFIPENTLTIKNIDYRQEVLRILKQNFMRELVGLEQIIAAQIKKTQNVDFTQKQSNTSITEFLVSLLRRVESYNRIVSSIEQKEDEIFEAFELKSSIYRGLDEYYQAENYNKQLYDQKDTDIFVHQIFELHSRIDPINKELILNCLGNQKNICETNIQSTKKKNKIIKAEHERLEFEISMLKEQYQNLLKKFKENQKQLMELRLNKQFEGKRNKNVSRIHSRLEQSVLQGSFINPAQIQLLKGEIKKIKDEKVYLREEKQKQVKELNNKIIQLQKEISSDKQSMKDLRLEIIKLEQNLNNEKREHRKESEDYCEITKKQVEQIGQKQKVIESERAKVKSIKKDIEDITDEKQLQNKNLREKFQNILQEKDKSEASLNEKIIILENRLRQKNSTQIINKVGSSEKQKMLAKELQSMTQKVSQLSQMNHSLHKEVQKLLKQCQQLEIEKRLKEEEVLENKDIIKELQQMNASMKMEIQSCGKKLSQIYQRLNLGNQKIDNEKEDFGMLQFAKKIERAAHQICRKSRQMEEEIEFLRNKQSQVMEESIKNPQKISLTEENFSIISKGSFRVSQSIHQDKSVQELVEEIEQNSKQYWDLYQRYQQAIQCLSKEQQKNVQNELKYQRFVEQLEYSNNQLPEDSQKESLTLRLYHLNRLTKEQRQTIETQRQEYGNIFKQYHNQFKQSFQSQLQQMRNQSIPPS